MKKKKPRKDRKAKKPTIAASPCEVCGKPLAASHSIMPLSVHPECSYKGFFDAVQQAFWKYFPWALLGAALPISAGLVARMAKEKNARPKKGLPKKKR